MIHYLAIFAMILGVVQVIMLFFWAGYLITRNVNIVDIGWGVGFIAAALLSFIFGEGFLWRKVLILTIASVWALRLVHHLVKRFVPGKDDPRYQVLLEKWPLNPYPHLQVLALFALQGLLVAILSIPFILMSQNPVPFFCANEVFALLIWMVGLSGETAADYQLAQFKSHPDHTGQVCKEGLWHYSRHPNYFFEWIIWVGYAVMALSSPFGWLGMVSPFLILYLLLKVSGIPLAEAQALRSKGEAYREYQKTTSPFFPFFP
jgi:steroid 5-alpha reductase family enzyme